MPSSTKIEIPIYDENGVLKKPGEKSETVLAVFHMDSNTGIITPLERLEQIEQAANRKPKVLGKLFSR